MPGLLLQAAQLLPRLPHAGCGPAAALPAALAALRTAGLAPAARQVLLALRAAPLPAQQRRCSARQAAALEQLQRQAWPLALAVTRPATGSAAPVHPLPAARHLHEGLWAGFQAAVAVAPAATAGA